MRSTVARRQPVEALRAAGFHHQVRWPVGWRDMDSFGHVNNAVFIMYMEHARVRYAEDVGVPLDANPQSQEALSIILASVSCRYRRPVEYPDTVVVGTRFVKGNPERGDFTLEHHVWSEQKQLVAAVGESGIVVYDYRKGKRAPIPDAWLAKMKNLDGVAAAVNP